MIPKHIKAQIEEKYYFVPFGEKYSDEWNIQSEENRKGAEFGYSLAIPELEAKDYQINELIRTTGNAQDRLIGEIDKRDKEIAFLKSQLENLEDDLKNAYPF